MILNTFIRELRRVESNPSLGLVQCKAQAAKWGVHPLCWQIWDRSPMTGEPYPVRPIATRDGLPREPTDLDFAIMARGRLENVCGGRTSWADLVAMRTPAEEDAAIDRKTAEWRDMLRHGGFRDAERILGHHKVFGVEKIGDARPNRRLRRAAKAQRP